MVRCTLKVRCGMMAANLPALVWMLALVTINAVKSKWILLNTPRLHHCHDNCSSTVRFINSRKYLKKKLVKTYKTIKVCFIRDTFLKISLSYKAEIFINVPFRCPSYQNLASTCVMVTDTNDPCCMVPKCGFDVSTGQIPVPVPSYGQATSGMGVVKPPMPTLYPTVYPDGPWVILNTTGHQPVAPTAPTNVKQGNWK